MLEEIYEKIFSHVFRLGKRNVLCVMLQAFVVQDQKANSKFVFMKEFDKQDTSEEIVTFEVAVTCGYYPKVLMGGGVRMKAPDCHISPRV